jgi:hypothetical protein
VNVDAAIPDVVGQHWPDIIVATLIATLGFLGRDRLRSMDARHKRAEDHMEKTDEKVADLKERVAILENTSED